MENNKKFVRRSFFAHQYEKEEEFLSKMASEGWHFVNLHKGLITKYEFDKGEPIDYVYQLDYVNKTEDTESYHQLFLDAGWEEVFSWDGVYDGKWYYFRKLRTGNKEDRIFTDIESKYQLYDKLMKKYGFFFLALLYLQINALTIEVRQIKLAEFPSIHGIGLIFIMSLSILFILVFGYMLLGLVFKRIQVKQSLDQRI